MEGTDGTEDGAPGELTIRRYMRFAEAGPGLIWFEAVATVPEGRASAHQLYLTENNVDAYKRLLDGIRETSMKANGYAPILVMQATNSGRYSKPHGYPEPMIAHHCPPLEDTPLPDERIVSDADLRRFEAAYETTARLCQQAGFDGMDIKCCHRYLACELLRAYDRPGEYGGSFEKRTRFLKNCYRVSQAGLGTGDFFLTSRLNAYDGFEYPYGFGVREDAGFTPDMTEAIRLIRELKDEFDIPMINIMMGNPYDVMKTEFLRVLNKYGITGERAELSATLFVNASRDGIHTHGLNRFPKFIKSIENGSVDVAAEAECVESLGVLERWDGHRGPGNLNAHRCMARAIELAHQQTIGVVALRNTNHWMRPGNYGLMAVDEGCIGILWTNTVPNMPPWGGSEARLGNNPVVFAVPNGEGAPVLLDVAMSMFSYGKLESYARSGKELPVDGGLNKEQQLTKNVAEILETHQCLPIGYWKGSGLSLMLDLVASALSGGRTTRQVGELPTETELSQVFIAIDVASMPDGEAFARRVRDTLADLQASAPVDPERPVYYPGLNMMRLREENMALGTLVEQSVWEGVLKL